MAIAALKFNTEIRLTIKVAEELSPGTVIFTNGDGNITTPEFYEATVAVVKLEENLLLVKRKDGETGRGPNGEWIIRLGGATPIKLYIPKYEEPIERHYKKILVGDIVEINNSREKCLVLSISKTSPEQILFSSVDNVSVERPRRLSVEEIHSLRYCGRKPLLRCSHYSCQKEATFALTHPLVTFYCEQHRPKPETIFECEDCGNLSLSAYRNPWPDVLNGVTRERLLCSSCYEARNAERQIIKNHSFKPRPSFIRVSPLTDEFRTKLFMGVECEVECPTSMKSSTAFAGLDLIPLQDSEETDDEYSSARRTLAQMIVKNYNKPIKWFYLKSDGSLSNGFELVTEPATVEAHQKMLPWKEVFKFMKIAGIKADTTSTCGLHIHVNKQFMEEAHRIRLGYFVNSQKTKMETLARRSASEYARFKPEGTPIEQFHVNTMGGKYEALNWNPPNTVEFRLFKGTIDHTNMMASLELAEACILYTLNKDIEFLRKQKVPWDEFKSFVMSNGFIYLPGYMTTKGVI